MSTEIIGRLVERRRLSEAVADPQIALIRIAGPSGSGKTALAMEALAKARARGALTGWGKYSEGDPRSAFGPFMAALGEVVAQALDQLYEPQAGIESLSRALGDSLGPLVQAGLHVDGVIAPATDAAGGRREGTVRITAAALLLAKWLDGFGFPIVLLIDDLHRAPAEVRALRLALASRTKSVPWTILSTIRRTGEKPLPGAFTLDLEPMARRDRIALLERMLGDGEMARRAFDWFGEDKLPTPGSVIEAARAIRNSGAIVATEGGPEFAPGRLFREAGDILRSAEHRISALSAAARTLGLAAALWGDTAPIAGLAVALERSSGLLRSAIDELVDAGIVSLQDNGLRFTHDQVRASVLSANGEGEQRRLCARMSDALRQAEGARFLTIALHFRLIAGLENISPEIWRDRFVLGATRAREQASAATATAFAEAAWSLRGEFGSVLSEVERRLLTEAVYAAADRADTAQIEERVQILIAGSQTPAQIAEGYALAIFLLWMAGAPEACWRFVRKGLAHFGIRIPNRAGRTGVVLAAISWRLRRIFPIWARSDSSAESEARLRIAHAAAYPSYYRGANDAALLTLKTNAHVSKHVRSSAYWLAVDSLLSALLGRFEDAADLAERALAQTQRPGFGHAATRYWATFFGLTWREPQAVLRPRCLEIWRLAIAEGDLPMAQGALRHWLVIGWRTSPSLADLERDVAEAESVLLWFHESEFAAQVTALRFLLQVLTEPGAAARPERFTRATMQPLHALEMHSFLRDWHGAATVAANLRPQKNGFRAHSGGPIWCFHESLARLKTGKDVYRRDFAYLKRAARLNPRDFAAKFAIVEAERLAQARKPEALAKYKAAVEEAQKGSSMLEAGIAAELARDAALTFGDHTLAESYAARAQEIWHKWGARAKQEAPSPQQAMPALESAIAEARIAEMSDRAKSRLLADVAHELRTPMQGMQSLLDIAQERPEALDVAALQDILGGLKRIADDLTDYGALSAGEAPVIAKATDIGLLLNSEARLLAGTGNTIEVEVGEEFPASVLTDGGRVRQVVRNLLSNAVKYGGRNIWVRASARREDAKVRITIRIEDDGTGLCESELRRIFEPFERGVRGGDGQGIGLGLAIARRIAERLAGTLSAENREEGGARFIFSFLAEVGFASPAIVAEPQRCIPLSILLADDVSLNRQAMAMLLRKDGHRVSEAVDGQEAIEALQKESFDVVLADLYMPRASGIEVVRAARNLGHGRPVPLIITANSDPAVHAQALEAGAARILRKPLAMPELREALFALAGLLSPREAENLEGAAELAALGRAAHRQIRLRAYELANATRNGSADSEAAHRLAGLAAQFLWPALAAAADALSEKLQQGAQWPELSSLVDALEAAIPAAEESGPTDL
jgi:signal transduction histidine kinase/CheY-like chemotaxis protein